MEMNIPSRVLESPTPLSTKSLQGTLVGRESLHGWQSSYAMDCRSMDPGANPGPCSIFRLSNRSRKRPTLGRHFLLKE